VPLLADGNLVDQAWGAERPGLRVHEATYCCQRTLLLPKPVPAVPLCLANLLCRERALRQCLCLLAAT
jgi:hypothetical protein